MTTRTITARIGLSLSLGLLVLAVGMRQAQGAEPRRLGVPTFRGPAEGATRNVVMKVGKTNKYQIVGGQQLAKTASKLHVTLDNNDGFKSVAKELGIAAFITGEVTKKKATLTVRNGLDGSVSAEASWTGANPRKLSVAVSKTLWRRLGSAINRTKPPAGGKAAAVAQEEAAPETGADDAVADEPAEKSKEKAKPKAEEKVAAGDEAADETAADRKSKKSKKPKGDDDEEGSETTVSAKAEPEEGDAGPGMEALNVSVGVLAVNRSLSYVQDLNRTNSKYNLAAAPETALRVDLYPAALAGMGGFVSNIGLTASVAYMLPVVSSPPPAAPIGSGRGKYATYSLDWSVGAKVRFPPGFYGTVGYGAHRYQLIAQGGATGLDVPMVDYRYVRIGAGARYHVTPEIVLMANGAYLHCLSLGQIRSNAYFPKATCGAFEAGAAIGYRINSLLEVQAGADIRRYGLAFHVTSANAAVPGTRVAGGAVDQYLMGWVALAMVLGGSEKGGGGGGDAKPEDEESHGEGGDDEEGASSEGAKAKKTSDEEGGGDDEAEKPSKKKKKGSDQELGL